MGHGQRQPVLASSHPRPPPLPHGPRPNRALRERTHSSRSLFGNQLRCGCSRCGVLPAVCACITLMDMQSPRRGHPPPRPGRTPGRGASLGASSPKSVPQGSTGDRGGLRWHRPQAITESKAVRRAGRMQGPTFALEARSIYVAHPSATVLVCSALDPASDGPVPVRPQSVGAAPSSPCGAAPSRYNPTPRLGKWRRRDRRGLS